MQGKTRKIREKLGWGVTRKKAGLFGGVILCLFFLVSPPLYADDNANFSYIGRGVFRILTAAFEIPRYLLQKTFSEPIGLGTVDGVLSGAFYSVAAVTEGLLDIGRGAVPYAKYLIFFA